MNNLARMFILFALSCAFATNVFSQTAQVTGTVVDSTGSFMAGARVVATNLDTSVAREAVTNASGNYLITALLPGRYRVTSEAMGFKQTRRESVSLAVDQIGRIDFAMEVGDTRQSVTVESSAVLLDTATGTIGSVVENKQIAELPLSGRNPLDLLGLSPGIRIQGNFTGKNGDWGNFSSNGGLANSNVVMVEGLALDLARMNGPSYVPPVDATQEFRVQTNNFSAEYGRTGGAVVNFSIKSGTNMLHGSLYEFLRNNALDGNNFFNNRAGVTLPAFRQNQFGASIGGPIKKDKTFYFANWEDYRQRSSSRSITSVPASLERSGKFSQTRNRNGGVIAIGDALSSRQVNGVWTRDVFPGNIIPTNRINRVGAAVTQVFPLSNIQGDPLTAVNNYATVGGSGTNEHQVVAKVDHNLNSRWKLFGTYANLSAKSFN